MNSASIYSARLQRLLDVCRFSVLPNKTILVYQNVDNRNRFYPVQFTPPLTKESPLAFLRRDDLAEWRIVLIETSDDMGLIRYAVFNPADYAFEKWKADRRTIYLSVSLQAVNDSMIPVHGQSNLLGSDLSLVEWMKQRKEQVG